MIRRSYFLAELSPLSETLADLKPMGDLPELKPFPVVISDAPALPIAPSDLDGSKTH